MRPTRQLATAAGEIDSRERRVVVGEGERAVRQAHREIGARPVEDGHEVVAEYAHARVADCANARRVVVDEPIARRPPELDVLVNGNALDDRERESRVVHARREPLNVVARPRFADGHVVECADDSAHAWNLADVRERNGIVGAEPTEGEEHGSGCGGGGEIATRAVLLRGEADAVAHGALPGMVVQPRSDESTRERVARAERIDDLARLWWGAVRRAVSNEESAPRRQTCALAVADRDRDCRQRVSLQHLAREVLGGSLVKAEDEPGGVLAGDEEIGEPQARLLHDPRALRAPELR